MNASHDTYRGLGVTLSSDRPLSFARASAQASPPELILEHTGDLDAVLSGPSWLDVHEMPDFEGGPVLEIATRGEPRQWRVRYTGWAFSLAPDDPLIRYTEYAEHEVSYRHVVERVIAPLARLIQSPRLLAMHGSALVWEGRAHVVLGASGSGKSTTVRAMLERGAKLLADDMVLVDVERGVVFPGAPTLRLWGDAPADALEHEEILGSPEKSWVRLPDECAATRSQELGSVLVLERVSGGEDAPVTGYVEVSSGVRALASVLGQCFDLTHPTRAWSTRRMANARRLVEWSVSRGAVLGRLVFAPDPEGRPLHLEGLMRSWGVDG